MIEEDANGRDPFDYLDSLDPKEMSLFAAEKAMYGEIVRDVEDIMTEYFTKWDDRKHKDHIQYIGFNEKFAEHSFEVEVAPGLILEGKIDAIAEATRRGGFWLVEHKSFNRRPSDDDRWRNLQSSSYKEVAKILGLPPVDGFCWDYVWSKPPKLPKELSSGGFSQARLETLPGVLRRFLRENGQSLSEYKKLMDQAKFHRDTWFFRVFAPVSRDVSARVFDDFISTAVEMSERHGTCQDMNIERHCSWCDYEPVCRAILQGLDHKYVKETQYEKSRKPDEDEGPDFEATA